MEKSDVTLVYTDNGVEINLKGDSLLLYRFAKQLHDKADEGSITESETPTMRLIKFTRTRK